ncbi:hypothetical protein THAOC_30455 [Thalassiosira oceanica]|uniref:Prefoldin subunit 2 n=1 Tax=Thalassiosira oceanica TaxID=159749 RepID=K0RNQ0_THAOC|nr:hypothetical protein THAOC_30455 [Thalassiosira oceanica]|eukprot:EJK50541.1 hypothetical protein THAOC_30455 [Thalassiosira oceanica]
MSSTAAPEPKNEQEVIGIYRQMNSELQSMVQSFTKFEMDRNEHRLVEETLEPMDPDRRAFRLVGGVLVERTIREVLPTVTENRKRMEAKQKDVSEWKAKYNIKTQEEVDAENKKR